MTDGACQSLTVMEYLIANGAERVIDELREQAYQIQVSSNPDTQNLSETVCSIVNFKQEVMHFSPTHL